jgi:hypothetical protein
LFAGNVLQARDKQPEPSPLSAFPTRLMVGLLWN